MFLPLTAPMGREPTVPGDLLDGSMSSSSRQTRMTRELFQDHPRVPGRWCRWRPGRASLAHVRADSSRRGPDRHRHAGTRAASAEAETVRCAPVRSGRRGRIPAIARHGEEWLAAAAKRRLLEARKPVDPWAPLPRRRDTPAVAERSFPRLTASGRISATFHRRLGCRNRIPRRSSSTR